MTDISPQRRIAASILDCGENRVWVDQDHLDDVALALTRDDVKILIRDGVIRKKQKQGVSRGRARLHNEQVRRGQRRGQGRRKGAKYSRVDKKTRWINRIRPQRRYLKALRDKGFLERSDYRKIYRKAKGGQYRSVSYLRNQLQEAGVLKTVRDARRR